MRACWSWERSCRETALRAFRGTRQEARTAHDTSHFLMGGMTGLRHVKEKGVLVVAGSVMYCFYRGYRVTRMEKGP